METLWQEAIKASRAIQRIHYYNPKLPIKLISDCLIEERENLWDESFGFEPNFESRQALIRHLIPAEVVDSLDNEAKDDWYESAMEGYKKQLNEFMDTYISIADSLNLDDLTKYSGDLVFVFPNKKLKTLFYNEIYEKLRGFREKITNEVFHFRSEKNGDGNAAVCVQKLQELNKFFFRTDVTIDATYIFRDKYDALGDSIEKFRAKIYHIEPELEEHWPIYQFLSAKIPSPKADP
jgi:hypothetical protein